MKYFEKFVDIMKWVSAVSITISVVVSVAVMAGYLGWGYEPMPIIHFAIVFSIISICICLFYFVLCAVDNIICSVQEWREKHNKKVNGANFI